MLAVVKKPRIEIRAKRIPASLIRAERELYRPENVIIEDDGPVPVDEIDALNEARAKTSPGEFIFINRDMRGWTQKDLAGRLRVSVQVVSDLENGRRTVSRKMAVSLGKAFGCRPDSFFSFGA